MIGREHHQRLPAMACRRDRLEQRSDRRVDGSNFAKVRVGKKPGREWFRGCVREMRLVQVHPAKVRLILRAGIEPPLRERDGFGAAPLLLEKRGPGLSVDEAVVVRVEPAVEAES